ncbi:toxin-antitoxin system toxin subunit [Bifidobacteriaceae bacterium N170]|nr:toxin-antitoxin system toxin subunit [Bifidobacteriaceae bacterium N170]
MAEPPRWATIGFDGDGNEIELVFVTLENNAILIIHANRLTKGFLQEIRDAR